MRVEHSFVDVRAVSTPGVLIPVNKKSSRDWETRLIKVVFGKSKNSALLLAFASQEIKDIKEIKRENLGNIKPRG